MANAEENYKQRLVELLGTTQDPFAKVASDEAQLDLVTQTFYEGLGDTAEASEAEVQVPEILTPLKDLHKVASIADFSDRDILESAPFQAGFRSVMEKRANEFEEALEKIAEEEKEKKSFLEKHVTGKRGKGLRAGAGIGLGLGAIAGAYGTHRSNQLKAPEDRKSLVGGALVGGAAGGVAGAGLGHLNTSIARKEKKAVKKAKARKGEIVQGAKNIVKAPFRAVGAAGRVFSEGMGMGGSIAAETAGAMGSEAAGAVKGAARKAGSWMKRPSSSYKTPSDRAAISKYLAESGRG